MKHKYIIAALAASALVISCQREENGPAQLEIVKTEELSLVLGDAPKSKVTVDGTTGDIAWNNGSDKIAVYVQGTGANEFQEKTVTDDAISVPLASGQSRAYFAVYPAASAVAAHYGNDYLAVQYPTSYDLTGKTVAEIETFSPVPMVADNTGSDALTFYHVGGLLRLSVAQTPKNTTEMVVTFTGANVTGTWRVSGGGTTSATLSNPTGTGNVVTYTMDALASAQTVTLNVPIPQGSYTGLTAIRVDAKAGSTTLASYTYSVTPAWASVTRALGRKESLSFADATLEITSDPATLWLNGTATYTASSGGSTVTWSSSATGVATVNSSTGEITPVAAGEADIIASINGGAKSVSKKVYVNSVSKVSLAPATAKVNPTWTTPLTATLTHSNNGTITSYPSVNFSSYGISYVRINTSSGTGSVAVTPVSATETTATATANAYGYAVGGPVTVTVTVPAAVSSTGSALTATSSVTCEDFTSITFPDWNSDGDPDGEPYKFRGLYMSPGILKYDGNSVTGSHGYTLTSGSDPLELLQHFWYDYNDTGKGFDGTAATHVGFNVYYHAWAGTNSLYHRLHNSTATSPNANITETITVSGTTWSIPTIENWETILTGTPTYTIKINSGQVTSNSYNYVDVTVDLATATKANGAAEDYNMKGLGKPGSSAGDKAGTSQYQTGYLLIPDGAKIYCSRITYVTGAASQNVINWDDLKRLTQGGCVFLPRAGRGFGTGWGEGGNIHLYWSATQQTTSQARCLYDNEFTWPQYKAERYTPVRLIHN